MSKTAWTLMIVLILIGIIAWGAIFPEYMVEHQYYLTQIRTLANRGPWIRGILLSVGALYLSTKSLARYTKVCIRRLVVIIFACIHISTKGTLSGVGVFGIIRNHTRILGIIALYIIGVHARGSILNDWIRLPNTVSGIVMQRGVGLVSHLLLVNILLLVGLFIVPVAWLVLAAIGAAIWYQRSTICEHFRIIGHAWSSYMTTKSVGRYIQHALLVLAIVYVLYGLQLSFIPYSTARDANHAYMFYPKIRADNGGLFWSDGPWTAPYLRYSHITQWFATMHRLTPITGIARDSIAIIMNFVTSAVGIILASIALFDRVSVWLFDRRSSQQYFTLASAGMLLLRLTSGMGAFLVFVDNKTDLGILLLVVLALLAAMVFINHIRDNHQDGDRSVERYAGLSGFFFACAFLGKPTAIIDIISFIGLVLGLHIGRLGLVGFGLAVVGVMAALQMRSTGTYLSTDASVLMLGGLLVLPAAWIAKRRSWIGVLRQLLIRAGILLLTVILFKSAYLIPRNLTTETIPSAGQWMRQLLLSQYDTIVDADTLLATTQPPLVDENIPTDTINDENTIALEQCSLETLAVSDIDELYNRQRSVVGGQLVEDNGRYVGFGQRTITPDDGLWYSILDSITPDESCIAADNVARDICDRRSRLDNDEMMKELLTGLYEDSDFIRQLADDRASGQLFASQVRQQVTEYYASRAITTTQDAIAVPYRRLVPLNITMNRSLQNASSYYTDIGMTWLILLIIMAIGFIRSILTRNRKLTTLTGVALLSWLVWILIADAIVRYGMGMIIWTILASIATLVHISDRTTNTGVYMIVITPLLALAIVQLGLNMARIGSQGVGGVFVDYKQGLGTLAQVEYSQGSITTAPTTMSIRQKDVFALQFPHYQSTIDMLQDRSNEDGVYIAGTYIQYFLDNQKNTRLDNLLTNLRRLMSDGDVCATSLRIQDQGYRTIILDPNIASVVQGDGNQSLKERLFMKTDADTNRIQDGVISMLARMVMMEYVMLASTNNLGIRYAYTLSSDEIAPYMQELEETDEVAFRARLALTRYLPGDDLQTYYAIISRIMSSRIATTDGLQDVASIFGQHMPAESAALIQSLIADGPMDEQIFNTLTEAQQQVLLRYIQLVQLAQTNPESATQQLSALITQSISSQSQIATFVLR